MNVTADIHTHTFFSDGKTSPHDMLSAAISKGLDTYGFSDHAHMKIASHWMMSGKKTDDYISEITALKTEFKDKIRILCGIEHDIFSDIELSRFDYVIGSVHYVDAGEEFLPVDATKADFINAVNRYFGGDPYAFCSRYFELLEKHAENPQVKIVGHFDLVEKFNDDGSIFDRYDGRYIKPALHAMEKLNSAPPA